MFKNKKEINVKSFNDTVRYAVLSHQKPNRSDPLHLTQNG
jgi:hypothetical protein